MGKRKKKQKRKAVNVILYFFFSFFMSLFYFNLVYFFFLLSLLFFVIFYDFDNFFQFCMCFSVFGVYNTAGAFCCTLCKIFSLHFSINLWLYDLLYFSAHNTFCVLFWIYGDLNSFFLILSVIYCQFSADDSTISVTYVQ